MSKLCQALFPEISHSIQIPVRLMSVGTAAKFCSGVSSNDFCTALCTDFADAGGVDFDNDDSVFPGFVVQVLVDSGA